MKKLLKYLSEYKLECITAPLLKCLEALMDLFVPLCMASLVDIGIREQNTGYIRHMLLVLILLAFAGAVFAIIAQWFSARAATGFAANVRHALFSHIQQLSFSCADTLGTDTLITRLTSDVNLLQTGVNMALRLLLRSPFIVFGSAVMAFAVDVQAGLVFAVAIPVLSVVVYGIMAITVPLYQKVQQKLDRIVGRTRENLTGVRVIRAFNLQERETASFQEDNLRLTRENEKAGSFSALTNPLTYVLMNLASVWLLNICAVRVNLGMLTQGQTIALLNYMAQILVELIKMANLIVTMTRAQASANRIAAVLDVTTDMKDGTQDRPLPENTADPAGRSASTICFSHVCFAYPGGGENALTDISFTALPGQTIGIIGGTGSGKSTLVSLIPRFYDVTSGSVKVDGLDVRDYTLSCLRSRVGFVLQKAQLFHGTIRQNVAFGNEKATDEEIWQALEDAQAADFVRQKPGGLDEEVEQAGRSLSGGQRQRLTIARALVRRPSILVLDDSASALDFATNARLRKAIRHLPYHPTTFIVSQRVSSIRYADQILVLSDEGTLSGTGTHEELLRSCTLYQEICRSQLRESEVKNA